MTRHGCRELAGQVEKPGRRVGSDGRPIQLLVTAPERHACLSAGALRSQVAAGLAVAMHFLDWADGVAEIVEVAPRVVRRVGSFLLIDLGAAERELLRAHGQAHASGRRARLELIPAGFSGGPSPPPTATRDVSAKPRGWAHEEPTSPALAPRTGPGSFPQSGFSG
jgi:hypothetical protein